MLKYLLKYLLEYVSHLYLLTICSLFKGINIILLYDPVFVESILPDNVVYPVILNCLFCIKALYNVIAELSVIENNIPKVIENSEEEKFLTSKQKFELMARKNPNLHVFKSLFNLDIEY